MKRGEPVEPVVPVFDKGDLPSHWELVPIGKICLPVKKVNPKEEPGAEFNYIDISGINNDQFRIAETKKYIGQDAPSRARQLVQTGDIVFSTVRTYLKNIARVTPDLDGQIASTGFCVLRAAEPEYSGYLYYYMLYEPFLNELAKFQRGTSYPAVRDGDIFAQFIPVPPKNEAARIVAEIEKQFSRLDEAVTGLKRVKANLKRYKAAVLKAAVEGKLTEQWRKEHPDIEHASELLKRILAERRAKWKGKGKYKKPAEPDISILPPLPKGWSWATIEQLAAPEPNSITDGPFGSNLKTEHYTNSGPRVIRLQNISDGVFIDEEAHISDKHFRRLQKHCLFSGDLVIAALGENLPRACVIPESLGLAIVKADCIRFKPHPIVLAKYLNVILNSEPTRQRMKKIVHGVGRPRLNLGEIKSITVALAPLTEQQLIVAEVERRLSIVEELDTEVTTNLQRAERLRQSILRKTFSGKLGLNDIKRLTNPILSVSMDT